MTETYRGLSCFIKSPDDIPRWTESVAYREYVNFLQELGNSVRGLTISEENKLSDTSNSVSFMKTFLGDIRKWVKEIPAVVQPMRFGNKAFQTWHDKLNSKHGDFLEKVIPNEKRKFLNELSVYLMNSFGSRSRIDYGTGHEINFCMFLLCLFKLEVFEHNDKKGVVLIVFNEYLATMRTLQKEYMLEPAGSRGVWGLDDYHFIPFYWGAFQLELQEEFKPADINDLDVVTQNSGQYLYFGAIKFILETKRGAPFAECAPMLYDISGVATWKKIETGLLKMYEAEVLQKFPIAQHFLFGELIQFKSTK